MGLDDILFGKKQSANIPSLNVTPLKSRLSQGIQRRTGLVGDTSRELSPLTPAYKSALIGRGQQLVGDVGQRGQQYGAQVANPALRSAFRDQMSREAFANVPALQSQIRQTLGGSGLTGNAAAMARLADPALQAARDVASGQLQYDLASEDARRQALRDVFQTDVGAEETALGLGREDILRKYGDLGGLIAEETSGLNELDLAQQQADIAKAQAVAEENARRSATRRGLFSGLASSVLPQVASPVFSTLKSAFQTPMNADLAKLSDYDLRRMGLV